MPGVLDGVRVVDWTMWYVGPEAAALLGDLGAEVIHIEEKGKGDQMRGLHTFLGIPCLLPGGRQVAFEHHNRNKKSLAVDLKKPQGREIVYRLVKQADVFVTNFRRPAAQKLGLDYATLSRYNPRLVYAWATAFGRRGPYGLTPGLDLVALARSGMMMASGDSGDAPTWISPGVGDAIGGTMLALGIVSALLARERYGIGQELTTSQLIGLMKLQATSVMTQLLTGRERPRQARTQATNPLYNWYRCADGGWIALGLLREGEWPRFCQAIGQSELVADPRFETYRRRQQNGPELVALLDQVFATRTRQEWCRLLTEADLIHSPVNRISDLPHDPQVVENDYIFEYDHPSLGQIGFIGFPVEFTQTPMTLRQPAPDLGQHTEEVLTELCGYSWEEVAQLREKEVL